MVNDHGMNLEQLQGLSVSDIRQLIRSGDYTCHTAGIGLGYLQGNLAIMPEKYALDFFRYCQHNPKPCPLVGVSDTGSPIMHMLGKDIDIRTDVPQYYVYENGVFVEKVTDIKSLWRDDFVAFVIGCSFTFEEALMAEGIEMRHISENKNVPMYRSNIKTEPSGPFQGDMVVSMRPLSMKDAIKAVEITSRFYHSHGAPVHLGAPEEIGISDLDKPDWGDVINIKSDEIPVFWACGVTPQVAISEAQLPICITHAPGCMLITDIPSSS